MLFKDITFTLLFALISTFSFAQNSYYVQQSIAQSGSGNSPNSPFKTIEEATAVVSGSDTIFIIGTYSNPSYNASFSFDGNKDNPHIWHGENTIRLNNLQGSNNNYITVKAYNSSTLLKGDGANIFRVTNCSYLRVEGFNIQGEVNNIPLQTALDLQFMYRENGSSNTLYRVPPGSSETDIDGMTSLPVLNNISRPSYTDTRGFYASNCQHLDVINNNISYMPGGGLRVAESDRVNVMGNEVHNCSRKSYSGTHGLVISNMNSMDNNNGFKVKVTHNLVHHNYNEIYSWSPNKSFITTHIDEGKGISLQRNNANYTWTHGKILVENNLTYWNGFSGLHSNQGARIEFINNTSYKNYYTPIVHYGETNPNGNLGISSQSGDDIKFINNIAYTDSGIKNAIAAGNTTNLEVKDNVVFGVIDSDVDAVDVRTTFADPLFVNAAAFDFNLQANSPAKDIALASKAPTDDYFKNMRDANPDIGAAEFLVVLPVELIAFTANKTTKQAILLQWQTATERDNDYFVIEKSADGRNWLELAEVSGAGTTNDIQRYDFLDKNPLEGANYYRLRQVDFDGAVSFSEVETVIFEQEKTAPKIYPNPAREWFILEAVDVSDLRIFDGQGREVTGSVSINSQQNEALLINWNQLPNGVYFVRTNGWAGTVLKH